MYNEKSGLSFQEFMEQLPNYDENSIPGASLLEKESLVHNVNLTPVSEECTSERRAWIASVLYATEREFVLLARRGALIGDELNASLRNILGGPPKYRIYVIFEGVVPRFLWGAGMRTVRQSATKVARAHTAFVPTKMLERKIRTEIEAQTFEELQKMFPKISFDELYYERHAVAGRYQGVPRFLIHDVNSFMGLNRAERSVVYRAELELAQLRREVYELKEIRANAIHYAARILKK